MSWQLPPVDNNNNHNTTSGSQNNGPSEATVNLQSFMQAAREDDIKTMAIMWNSKKIKQIDAHDKNTDQTPLEVALLHRCERSVRFLLDRGAKVEAITSQHLPVALEIYQSLNLNGATNERSTEEKEAGDKKNSAPKGGLQGSSDGQGGFGISRLDELRALAAFGATNSVPSNALSSSGNDTSACSSNTSASGTSAHTNATTSSPVSSATPTDLTATTPSTVVFPYHDDFVNLTAIAARQMSEANTVLQAIKQHNDTHGEVPAKEHDQLIKLVKEIEEHMNHMEALVKTLYAIQVSGKNHIYMPNDGQVAIIFASNKEKESWSDSETIFVGDLPFDRSEVSLHSLDTYLITLAGFHLKLKNVHQISEALCLVGAMERLKKMVNEPSSALVATPQPQMDPSIPPFRLNPGKWLPPSRYNFAEKVELLNNQNRQLTNAVPMYLTEVEESFLTGNIYQGRVASEELTAHYDMLTRQWDTTQELLEILTNIKFSKKSQIVFSGNNVVERIFCANKKVVEELAGQKTLKLSGVIYHITKDTICSVAEVSCEKVFKFSESALNILFKYVLLADRLKALSE